MKIMVITVGGSPEPVITSLNQNRPNRVYFVCSDDSSTVKGSYTKIEKILQNCNITDLHYETIKINNFDNFNDCYITSHNLLKRLRKEYPDSLVFADYTGATKSMSAGLASAATDVYGITLCLVAGDRVNLEKVEDGTQNIRLSHAYQVTIRRQLEIASSFLKHFDYPAAIRILEELLKNPDIAPADSDRIQYWLTINRALLAWDKFDHINAWKMLSIHKKYYLTHYLFLQTIICARKRLDPEYQKLNINSICPPKKKCLITECVVIKQEEKDVINTYCQPKSNGYELVEDLLLNAERCGERERYDDAVARLYRALELLAQSRLKIHYDLDNSALQTDKLPTSLQTQYQTIKGYDDKIKLALISSYELLSKLADYDKEPLGILYRKYKNELKNFLEIRNKSILAHGFNPVSYDNYQTVKKFSEQFIDETLNKLSVKVYAKRIQFPRTLNEQ